MESIYLPSSYRASDNFEIARYFENYSEVCRFSCGGSPTDNFCRILEEMHLSDFNELDLSSLEACCSINILRLPNEPMNLPMEIPDKLSTKTKLDVCYPLTTEATQLNVIRCKEALEKKWLHSEFKFGGKRALKMMIMAVDAEIVHKQLKLNEHFHLRKLHQLVHDILEQHTCALKICQAVAYPKGKRNLNPIENAVNFVTY